MNKNTKLTIISSTMITGGLLGALWLRAPDAQSQVVAEPIEQIQIVEQPTEQPEEIAKAAPEPTPKVVEAKKIELAIAHEDEKTDFLHQARKELEDGELKLALVSLRKHIHNNTPDAETLLMLGITGRQLGERALAEAALKKAAELDPQYMVIQQELARVYMGGKEMDKAYLAAQRAISLERDSASSWNLLGRIEMARSEWHRAEIAMRRAVSLEPTNAMFHNNMGLLYIYMREANSAIDSLETAVELFEDDTPHFVYNNLGLAHEMASNHEEAREAFEEALLIRPFYTKARVNLRRVETKIAQLEEKAAFETAQSLSVKDIQPELKEDI